MRLPVTALVAALPVVTLFVTLSALIAFALPAAAQAVDAKAWVGKYPFDKIGGTVGPQLARAIRGGWGPQTPVKFHDGWTIAWICKAHDCGNNNVTVAINANGRMVACIERSDEKPPIRWQEIGHRVVPQDKACQNDAGGLVQDMRRLGILDR